MGGVANLALQAIPVIASAQKTVSGFQTAGDARYAAQLDAQQKADALAFEERRRPERSVAPKPALRSAADADDEPCSPNVRPRPCVARRQQTDIENRRAQIEASAASDEAARLKALRRTVGRTRASLGSPRRRHVGRFRRGAAAWAGGRHRPHPPGQPAPPTACVTQALARKSPTRRQSNLLERSQLAEKQRLELFSNAY